MYQLIIADDEELVREGLQKYIDWEALGFEIVGKFEDGKEVINYLNQNTVDVIFTDVQMYDVSGLEVARWTAQNQPTTKVVILSGYKEFDYIKEALEARVCDYVLKPIEPEEIERVFLKIREELDYNNAVIHKNVSSFFLYRTSQEYKNVTDTIQQLVNSILLGEEVAFSICFDKWKRNMQMIAAENIPPLIYQLFDQLYDRLSNIYLKIELQKEEIYREIDTWAESQLYEQIHEVLIHIVNCIYANKKLNTESLTNRAKAYIEEHISEDFGLNDVISRMYVSRSKFTEEFKKETGENFIDYVIRRRMETAMEMIKRGSYSCTKIASAVGYSDLKYFQKSFKKYTGYSIKEYQRLFYNEK